MDDFLVREWVEEIDTANKAAERHLLSGNKEEAKTCLDLVNRLVGTLVSRGFKHKEVIQTYWKLYQRSK